PTTTRSRPTTRTPGSRPPKTSIRGPVEEFRHTCCGTSAAPRATHDAHVPEARHAYRGRPEASTAAPRQAHRPFFNEPLMFGESGKARLAYEVTGAGPDVLLIHAGVNDRRSWRHVIERLAPHYRCVAFDMRGHGETVYEPERGWSPVADAVAVLDAAGVAS